MARPSKTKVDYFPHVTHTGKTIAILEARWGNDGYAFWFKLLELLGDSSNFSYNCNQPSDWEYLLSKARVTEAVATSILDKLAEIDAIDKELWAEKIVWSDNFVSNLEPVFDKRKSAAPKKPEFPERKPDENEISASLRDGNSDEPVIIPTETDKVKESKGEEPKEVEEPEGGERACVREAPPELENEQEEKPEEVAGSATGGGLTDSNKKKRRQGKKLKHSCPSMLRDGVEKQADTVYLKPEEVDRLCLDYGESGAKRIIELLDGYKTNRPGKCAEYRDDYKVIVSWGAQKYLEECERRKKPERDTSRSPSYAMNELEKMAKEALENDEG